MSFFLESHLVERHHLASHQHHKGGGSDHMMHSHTKQIDISKAILDYSLDSIKL